MYRFFVVMRSEESSGDVFCRLPCVRKRLPLTASAGQNALQMHMI